MSEVPLYLPKEVLGLEKGRPSDEQLIAAYKVWSSTHDKVINM